MARASKPYRCNSYITCPSITRHSVKFRNSAVLHAWQGIELKNSTKYEINDLKMPFSKFRLVMFPGRSDVLLSYHTMDAMPAPQCRTAGCYGYTLGIYFIFVCNSPILITIFSQSNECGEKLLLHFFYPKVSFFIALFAMNWKGTNVSRLQARMLPSWKPLCIDRLLPLPILVVGHSRTCTKSLACFRILAIELPFWIK